MAPLRSVLSSRVVVVSLAAFGAFFLLMSTVNDGRYNLSNVAHGIQWEDATSPASGLGPGLSVYPGRRPLTIQRILEKAEVQYQTIIQKRAKWLVEYKFGTPEFNPWIPWMYWWWYFPPSFTCPHDILRVGPLQDGGKWICGMSLYEEHPRPKCVIYSFGISTETRFEGEMMDRTDCEIWAYDASVSKMGPESDGRPKVHFKPYFIGKKDEVDAHGKQWRTLSSLMKENGHDWIDILKVDIEGNEFPVFHAIMDDFGDVLPFSQLQIEFHVHDRYIDFPSYLKWWERLESKGIRPFWTEPNPNPTYIGERLWAAEYCFINLRGGAKNLLIQNY